MKFLLLILHRSLCPSIFPPFGNSKLTFRGQLQGFFERLTSRTSSEEAREAEEGPAADGRPMNPLEVIGPGNVEDGDTRTDVDQQERVERRPAIEVLNWNEEIKLKFNIQRKVVE